MATVITQKVAYFAYIFICLCLLSCSASLSHNGKRDFTRGSDALAAENYDDAVKHFTEYLQKSPEDADAHLKLGLAFLKNGNLKDAVDQFKESLRLNPENDEAQLLIKESIFEEADRFFSNEKNDIGMRYLTAYLTINSDDVDTHIMLAKEFIRMGSTRNAINSLNKAVSLDPKHPEVVEMLDYFSDGFH